MTGSVTRESFSLFSESLCSLQGTQGKAERRGVVVCRPPTVNGGGGGLDLPNGRRLVDVNDPCLASQRLQGNQTLAQSTKQPERAVFRFLCGGPLLSRECVWVSRPSRVLCAFQSSPFRVFGRADACCLAAGTSTLRRGGRGSHSTIPNKAGVPVPGPRRQCRPK